MSKEKEPAMFTNEPRAITLKDKTFVANGNRYVITDKISIERWKEYEKLQMRLTYGVNFEQLNDNLKKAFSLLNKSQPEPLKAGIILHNIMSGIKDADDESRVHPGLLMCTLVMNKEGEDVSTFDEQVAMDKIKDWREEGLDILSFFSWALNSIKGFRGTYLSYIQAQAELLISSSDLMKQM